MFFVWNALKLAVDAPRWWRGRTPHTGKIFCIGCNKTGTTSIGVALESLGYRLGDQQTAERFVDDWARRDFNQLVEYCDSADAFQDVPFSLADTYKTLDRAFPGSKFVLTVRDSADQWFDSMTRFHTKLLAKGRLPTADDLREFQYNEPGWMWKAHQLIFLPDADEALLYNRPHYKRQYEAHNRAVKAYFRWRPADLLVLNLRRHEAMDSLCRFLGFERGERVMPHLNKSA